MKHILTYLADGGIQIGGLPQDNANPAHVQLILNIVFVISGSIAVLIIVLAGFRFVISHGNPSEVAKARNAILYSLIGLVVVISAAAIVNFVIMGVG